mmetsp:Transcript_11696/g.27803  ORF Transcript_11696/g.27803 Transcript_11696/m.27803 type:complete len:90 (-) Transcript_11696:1108-1377(-)
MYREVEWRQLLYASVLPTENNIRTLFSQYRNVLVGQIAAEPLETPRRTHKCHQRFLAFFGFSDGCEPRILVVPSGSATTDTNHGLNIFY